MQMDLRLVRFRAWELGIIAEPPPCQLHDDRGATGCWCFLEPAAKRNSSGILISHSCPARPTITNPTIVVVGWDDE
jgi:hypothetical protein